MAGFSNQSSVGTSTSSSGTRVLPDLMNVYRDTLQANQNAYKNTISAYQNAGKQLQGTLPSVYQGYNQLNQNVQNTLGMGGHGWGVAQPGADAIARSFAQAQGKTQSQLTSSGLGNTTIYGNAQHQNALMAGQAYGNLGAQLADKYAGYQSQIGLARQGAMMQGAGLQNSLNQTGIGAIAGRTFGNTAGNLTGQYSQSQSNQSSSGVSQNYDQSPYARGGGYGGQSGTEGHSAESLFGPFGGYGAPASYGNAAAYQGQGSPYVQLPGAGGSGQNWTGGVGSSTYMPPVPTVPGSWGSNGQFQTSPIDPYGSQSGMGGSGSAGSIGGVVPTGSDMGWMSNYG